MQETLFSEYLIHFGLTRQEALIYQSLLLHGKQTGYEAAKETGISRSNAYNALSALLEKGAAYLLEGSVKRYIPVTLQEFCDNCIRKMEMEKAWMISNLPETREEQAGYITIEGEENIRDKMRNLLAGVKERVYISCTYEYLSQLEQEIDRLLCSGKKVVIITDHAFVLKGAKVYKTLNKGRQIGVITDSRYVLSGEYGNGGVNTCLYSGQHNFVQIFKSALANEIKLIELQEGK